MKFLKCDVCGKIVAVIRDTDPDTICCGRAMRELVPGTTDGATEKHVPVFTVAGDKVTVKVGSAAHPMTDAHRIEWIVLETDRGEQRKALASGDEPAATFTLMPGEQVLNVYEFCNLHGLWKA